LIGTEGATDPELYEALLNNKPLAAASHTVPA
jgi:hypothetical protein